MTLAVAVVAVLSGGCAVQGADWIWRRRVSAVAAARAGLALQARLLIGWLLCLSAGDRGEQAMDEPGARHAAQAVLGRRHHAARTGTRQRHQVDRGGAAAVQLR